VEAVGLMIPAIAACILLLIFGLRLAAAGQALTAAAAAAARSASLQPTSSSALASARAQAETALSNGSGRRGCTQIHVGLDGRAFRPGGTAIVSLTCTLSVSGLAGIGLPGHLTRSVTSRAPIDLYSASSGQAGGR
jgi:hypothetical protein